MILMTIWAMIFGWGKAMTSRYLLDTHIFIWADSEPERLSKLAINLINDPNHQIYLSLASLWEMQIKLQLGKLTLSMTLVELIKDIEKSQNFIFLPIEKSHILALANLPMIHKDPFDRLIIAQALSEDMTIITDDGFVKQYPISTAF